MEEISQTDSKEGVTEVLVDSEDYYHVLGIAPDATEKQISIAFKKLCLKYHPDRNVDDDYAAAKYKAVNLAYQVLSDPNKRKQYDARGKKTSDGTAEGENAAAGAFGGLGKVFGAVITRFVPMPSQVSADIIQTAQTICKNGGIEGGGPPLDSRVSDLAWGWPAEAKVDRQTTAYYRLTVDAKHAETGFVVHCRSSNKGKFKLILFEKEGQLLHQEESFRDTKDTRTNYTQATLYFTAFDTYRLMEPNIDAVQDKSTPWLFSRLEGLAPSRKKITTGQYLLCIYGENFIGRTNLSIVAVPAKNDAAEVHALEEADEVLLETKSALDALRNEYMQTKLAYEHVLEKISAAEDKLDGDVLRREKLYNGFLDASIKAFSPSSAAAATGLGETNGDDNATNSSSNVTDASTASSSSDGAANASTSTGIFPAAALSFITTNTAALTSTAVSTAGTVHATATQTATAATGWIQKRLSILQTFTQRRGSETEETVGDESTSSADAIATSSAGDGALDEVSHGPVVNNDDASKSSEEGEDQPVAASTDAEPTAET